MKNEKAIVPSAVQSVVPKITFDIGFCGRGLRGDGVVGRPGGARGRLVL
jgi:hypothetical protein